MTEQLGGWEKKQAEPLGVFDLAKQWSEALKVLGAGNGAGLLASGAALSSYSSNPNMLFWIKIGGVIFFLGVAAFSFAFALLQLATFSHDEMLHALRTGDVEKARIQKETSASAMVNANRLAVASAACFFSGLCVGLVAFLSFQPTTAKSSQPSASIQIFEPQNTLT